MFFYARVLVLFHAHSDEIQVLPVVSHNDLQVEVTRQETLQCANKDSEEEDC